MAGQQMYGQAMGPLSLARPVRPAFLKECRQAFAEVRGGADSDTLGDGEFNAAVHFFFTGPDEEALGGG